MSNEYRVSARIRNNRLWEALHGQYPGCRTQIEFAEKLGVGTHVLGALLNMRNWPFRESRTGGRWSPIAEQIAKRLHLTPDFLFDREFYGRPARPVEIVASAEQVRELMPGGSLLALQAPDQRVEQQELERDMRAALEMLTPREARVLRLRSGMEDGHGYTLREIAELYGLSLERTRQIEIKALRKLRHPSRSKLIREHVEA